MSILLVDNSNRQSLKDKIYESIVNIRDRHLLYRKLGEINNNEIVKEYKPDNILRNIVFKFIDNDLTKAENIYEKYKQILINSQYKSIDDIYNNIGMMLKELRNNLVTDGKQPTFRYVKTNLDRLMFTLICKNGLVYELNDYEHKYGIYYRRLEKYNIDYKEVVELRNSKFGKIPINDLKIDRVIKFLIDNITDKKDFTKKDKNEIIKEIATIESDIKEYNIYDMFLKHANRDRYRYINEYIDLIKLNEKNALQGKTRIYNIKAVKDIYLYLIDSEFKPKLSKNTLNVLKDIYKDSSKSLKNYIKDILSSYKELDVDIER